MNRYLFLLGLLIGLMNPLFSQVQLGSDIDGEAAGDFFGLPVVISGDGNRVIIGATLNDENGASSGHARVYEYNGVDWEQVGDDIDGDSAGDELGRTVTITGDGNRIAVGAPFNDANGTDAGLVRIYDWIGGSWVQVGSDIMGDSAGDFLGGSVSLGTGDAAGEAISFALNGNRIAVGAPLSGVNGANSGYIKVFDLVNGNWIQVGSDILGNALTRFGSSVRLSSDGTRVAVGAPSANSSKGYVKVFDLENGNWEQVGSDILGETNGEKSGGSVSLSADGNRIAIGSPNNSDVESYGGQVRVYKFIDGDWLQLGEDFNGAEYSFSGWSVSLSANGYRLAIGAPGDNQQGDNWTGSTKIFDYIDGVWLQAGVTITAEASGDFFSHSNSLSADGNRLASGAKRNSGNGSNSGHARIFGLESITVAVENISEENSLKIIPNPSKGKFRIEGLTYDRVRILNNHGELILDQKGKPEEIDITNLPAGIYFMQVSWKDQFLIRKIVKQ